MSNAGLLRTENFYPINDPFQPLKIPNFPELDSEYIKNLINDSIKKPSSGAKNITLGMDTILRDISELREENKSLRENNDLITKNNKQLILDIEYLKSEIQRLSEALEIAAAECGE